MSQCRAILNYIEKCGKITSYDAFRDLNCTRLSGRICDLRDSGYPIVTRMVEKRDEQGKLKCRYAEYVLPQEKGV